MNRFTGKVAVVTGGSSGIGLAAAKAYAEEGAKVVITGRNRRALDDAAKEIGGDVLAVQSDASKLGDIDKLMNETKAKFGKIDALFINAGIVKFPAFTETTEAAFDEVMAINFKGAYFTLQKAVPFLNDNSAVVLNTTTVDEMGLVGMSVYAASKAALRSLARTASAELVGRNIRVNAVAPGPIETPVFGKLGLSEEALSQMASGIVGLVPMKRLGSPQDIANAVLFLSSPESSYVLGVELTVDVF